MQSTRCDSTGTVDTCCQGLYFIHTTRQIQYNDILNSSIHDSTYVENDLMVMMTLMMILMMTLMMTLMMIYKVQRRRN